MRALLPIAALVLGAPPALFSEGGQVPIPISATPKGVADQSARACAGCHAEIYEQWKGSMHSAAWNDSQFQELWRSNQREARCLNCHSPMAAQQPMLASKPNPGFQPTLQSEGVSCAACHIRDGRIVGAGTSKGPSEHPITRVEALSATDACSGCHQMAIPGRKKGLYDTVREWRATEHARKGGACRDCHMPLRAGNVATEVFRPYRSHAFDGSHSDALLQRALTVTLLLDKPGYRPGEDVNATVSVRNTGAAHHVPSGDPLHQIRMVVGLADSRGEFLEKKETMFARKMVRRPPYKERVDTRIEAGGGRKIKFSARYPGGAGEHYVIIQLSYHLMPPEQARELGIPEEVTARVFDSQIIPITQ